MALSWSVREPGRPATPMSDRLTVHDTATVTHAEVPGDVVNPEVSTLTWTSMQCRPWLVSAVVAVSVATCWAAAAERVGQPLVAVRLLPVIGEGGVRRPVNPGRLSA